MDIPKRIVMPRSAMLAALETIPGGLRFVIRTLLRAWSVPKEEREQVDAAIAEALALRESVALHIVVGQRGTWIVELPDDRPPEPRAHEDGYHCGQLARPDGTCIVCQPRTAT